MKPGWRGGEAFLSVYATKRGGPDREGRGPSLQPQLHAQPLMQQQPCEGDHQQGPWSSSTAFENTFCPSSCVVANLFGEKGSLPQCPMYKATFRFPLLIVPFFGRGVVAQGSRPCWKISKSLRQEVLSWRIKLALVITLYFSLSSPPFLFLGGGTCWGTMHARGGRILAGSTGGFPIYVGGWIMLEDTVHFFLFRNCCTT